MTVPSGACLLLHNSSLGISLWVSIFISLYVFVLFLFGEFVVVVVVGCVIICLFCGAGNRTQSLMHDLSLGHIPRKVFFSFFFFF